VFYLGLLEECVLQQTFVHTLSFQPLSLPPNVLRVTYRRSLAFTSADFAFLVHSLGFWINFCLYGLS